MQLHSDAIAEGKPIPRRYTADGDNISPPLRWTDVPEGCRELALIVDDVKTTGERRHTHWVVFGIAPSRTELPEGILHQQEPDAAPDVAQGTNSQGNVGYNGPQPPIGSPHRYLFRLLALDRPTGLAPGAGREALEAQAAGHVITEADLRCTYARPRT